jgi:predicted phage terminase large subunit-like protein
MGDVYAQEYLNEPISSDNLFFEKEDFIALSPEDKNAPVRWYASADLAISEKDKRAFTVISIGAVDEDMNLQVRRIYRGRWNALEIIERFFAIQQQFNPEIFWIEKENIARALGPVVEVEMRNRNIFINFVPLIATKDKVTRARALQARHRAGAMRYDKEAEWYPDLEQEMLRFPRGAYVDQVDALAWLAFGVNEMVEPLTPEEEEEQDYYDEFGEDLDLQNGRDPDSGY